MAAAEAAGARTAVLVSGPSLAAVRRFIAYDVRRPLGFKKTQWRGLYREAYPVAVLSRALRPGESAQAVYGPLGDWRAIVLPAPAEASTSLRADLLAWLKAEGFAVSELELPAQSRESERIELGAEVVRYLNGRCPWGGSPAGGPSGDNPSGAAARDPLAEN